jgi:hypothetical protein
MTHARQSIYFGGRALFGDGKPIILLPQISNALSFTLLSNWLSVLGYRPATASISADVGDRSITDLIHETTRRIGRKAVLVVPASGQQRAMAVAEAHQESVSDIVVLNASPRTDIPSGVRTHFIAPGWSLHLAMATLPKVLRNIPIELIQAHGSVFPGDADGASPPLARQQVSVGGQR